jgi:catechol 2,3-dioxygenase-like lactoylglutathione lyase family enzyme
MPALPTTDPEQFYQGAPLLTVPDVMAAVDHYQRLLGFQADADAVTADYGVVWRDNAAVHFALGADVPTGVRIFFWVRDVDRLYAEVQARGVRQLQPIGTRPYHVRDFSIRDLNGIELVFGQDWD